VRAVRSSGWSSRITKDNFEAAVTHQEYQRRLEP
jgi:hypothetical protein